MKILAIESSCDDTAVAILNNQEVLVSLIASQEKLHAEFGGVVPEVASREHMKAIYPLIEMALRKAKLKVKDIDAIAVTVEPGLLGSLLVGINAAKTLGYLWKKPVIEVNHLLGHVYAGFIDNTSGPEGHPVRRKVSFPVIALVASGGHTELVLVRHHGDYKYLGGTRDDAAGEAFDKAAKTLGLGYPGGPAIAAEAAKSQATTSKIQKNSRFQIPDSKFPHLPRPMIDSDDLNFSFSGLKTAVIRAKGKKENIAYEFQEAVVDVLTSKLIKAARKYKVKTIMLGGGVAANQVLRSRTEELAKKNSLKLIIPDFKYCTDNAAMIGMVAYHLGK